MNLRKISLVTLVAFIGMLFVGFAQARQTRKCDDSILEGYKIRSVKVDARYLSISLPSKGASYLEATLDSDGGHNKLLQEVQQAIALEENRENIVGATLNQINGKLSTVVEVKAITQCVEVVDEDICQTEVSQKKCVDITVFAKALRFNPNNPAESLLSAIPRSSSSTILSNVPKPLLILNPDFGVEYDKRFGLSQNVKISTNLLDLNELLEGKAVKVKSLRFDVKAEAKKSLNKSFYDSNVGISISKFLPSRFVEKISGTAKLSNTKLPNGDAAFFQNALSLDGSVLLKPNIEFIKSVVLEGGYARENNRFISNNVVLSTRTKENGFHFRTLINSQIKRDVLRVGFWADGGKTDDSIFSYKRFAGLVGYAKDFGKGNQTFGLETMFGAGRVSGDIPNYAYFYGSNELKNFIYEANDSRVIQKMPEGPLIRSFGNGQAINNSGTSLLNGSNSYWHFNFNLSVPIAKWSIPLIPNESLELPDETTSIRDLIKSQATSGEVILGAIYKKQGVNNFSEKAKKEFKGINSAINFLTDHANLYSVKPLFMLDAANFNGPNGINKTRIGVGGGLQLNVVIAKFEAGYMRTANPQVGDSRGNFIMRLYFQNLF